MPGKISKILGEERPHDTSIPRVVSATGKGQGHEQGASAISTSVIVSIGLVTCVIVMPGLAVLLGSSSIIRGLRVCWNEVVSSVVAVGTSSLLPSSPQP